MASLRAEVQRGRTVVLTTQVLSEAEELCDDILIVDKGRQVARVIEVDESTASAEPPRRPRSDAGPGRGGRDSARDQANAVEMTGTVKWFNTDKGFGFIAPEGGGKDVFIHISVLGKSGITGLAEGQQVSMRIVETPKGREAISITLAG